MAMGSVFSLVGRSSSGYVTFSFGLNVLNSLDCICDLLYMVAVLEMQLNMAQMNAVIILDNYFQLYADS